MIIVMDFHSEKHALNAQYHQRIKTILFPPTFLLNRKIKMLLKFQDLHTCGWVLPSDWNAGLSVCFPFRLASWAGGGSILSVPDHCPFISTCKLKLNTNNLF